MTGEPVGNAPRGGANIPGNSHRDREAAVVAQKSKEVEREPVKQIVTGKAVVKKPSWVKRWGRSIVADDATSVGDYIMSDVIIPAIRDLIANSIKGGTDRVLYGPGRVRGRGVGGVNGAGTTLRTRYDQMAGDPGELRPRQLPREARARHDFSAITLPDRQEAILVLETMIERVRHFGSATVADLYDACGVTGSWADRNHGWTNLEYADIRQTGSGWLLDFPQPIPLR